MLSLRSPAEGLAHWAITAPHEVALQDAQDLLTFGQVHSRASAIGAQARDVLDGQPTAALLPVIVDRSIESCLCVLACLIGRVPFTPIDSAASPEYTAALLRRIGSPRAVLAGAGVRDDAVPHGVMRVEATAEEASGTPSENGGHRTGIVTFTSGSTGRPKGVVLSRETLDRRWRFRNHLTQTQGHGYRAPLIAPLDSMAGIAWLTDIASGVSHLLLDAARLHPTDFLTRISEFEATYINLPAPLARVLSTLPSHRQVALPSVRMASIGIEGFRYEVLQGLIGILSPSTVIRHGLASTEGGRVLHWEFPLDSAPTSGLAHVGLPYFPTDVRIRPVEGAAEGAGELLVSGAIASEYLDDPELTSARFVTDDDGRRWWCSGDLVEMTPEGLYRFDGRLDDVIKVRGRIASPSAVADCLLGIDGIRSAVVVPHIEGSSAQLVAHVEVEDSAGLTPDSIREVLARQLPSHLIPAAIWRHAALPVSARGKVDREALTRGPFLAW